jgi:predicted nucleic acid-binding protein
LKKLRIYTDTSVIGGCFDDEFSEHSIKLIEEITRGKYIGVISEVTVREILRAPSEVRKVFEKLNKYCEKVELTKEVTNLAGQYLRNKIVSQKYTDDAAHIAYATVYNVDVPVSWNFKHIVNYNKIIQFNGVNVSNGFRQLNIYSPRELISNE